MKREKKSSQTVTAPIDDIISETDYRKANAKLKSIQRKRSGKTVILLFSFFLLISSFAIYNLFFDWYSFGFKTVFISLFSGCLISVFFIMYFLLSIEMLENTVRRKIDEYEAENLKNDVEEDIFENSIKMSYKYLDQYYSQTKEQAQKGFWATMFVAALGAILIAGGIIAMYFGAADSSYVTCGAGVITEFISAVFFYLYNRTVSSMGSYHNKLVLSHNVSIALKVAESLPADDQAKAKNQIVSELLKDVNTHMIKNDSCKSNNE